MDPRETCLPRGPGPDYWSRTRAQSLPGFCLRLPPPRPITVDPRIEIILSTANPNSLYAHRCLQETWGQITSLYLNTRKRYEWLHFSEDCLYLNVYAPVLAAGDPLLPVSSVFHHPSSPSTTLQPSSDFGDLSCPGDGLVPRRRLPRRLRFYLRRLRVGRPRESGAGVSAIQAGHPGLLQVGLGPGAGPSPTCLRHRRRGLAEGGVVRGQDRKMKDEGVLGRA